MDPTALKTILRQYHENGGNIISLLQDTQEAFGYVPREAVQFFAAELGIAPSRFYGIATFYAQFRHRPLGEHKITACCGTACHVQGAERILSSIRRELRLPEDQDTTPDNKFTLEQVNCVGACGIAPVVMIGKQVHGKSTPDRVVKAIRGLKGKPDAGT